MCPTAESHLVLHQCTHSSTETSSADPEAQAFLRYTMSALNNEFYASAIASSYESPLEPTDATAPEESNRSAYRADRYCNTTTRGMNQPRRALPRSLPGTRSHRQRVDRKVSVQAGRSLPTDDPVRENIQNESGIHPPRKRANISDIRDPQLVRRVRLELALHEISGTLTLWSRLGRPREVTPHHARMPSTRHSRSTVHPAISVP